MADPPSPPDPVLDIRVRWRAGRVALGLAGLLTVAAMFRPLAESSPAWLRASDALLLGLGVTGSALLASLKGRKRPETLALYEPGEFKGVQYRLMKPIDFDPQKTKVQQETRTRWKRF